MPALLFLMKRSCSFIIMLTLDPSVLRQGSDGAAGDGGWCPAKYSRVESKRGVLGMIIQASGKMIVP